MTIPLSYHQERLWFIDYFEKGSVYESNPVYHNIPLIIHLIGEPERDLLEEGLNIIVERHSALRTKFTEKEDGVFQIVNPHTKIYIKDIRLDILEDFGSFDQVLDRIIDDSMQPFDIKSDLLIRSSFYRFSRDNYILLLTLHHLIADIRSLQLIVGELAEYYSTRIKGDIPELPDNIPQYVDYVQWQLSLSNEILEPHLLYWNWQLRGKLENIQLPASCPRPPIHTYTFGQKSFLITEYLTEQLRIFSRRNNLDFFSVLLAGFKVLINSYVDLDEIVIGINDICRDLKGTERIIGPLANLLVIRSKTSENPSIFNFIMQVNKTVRKAREHKAMPFDKLVKHLNPEKDMSRTALFDILFQFEDNAQTTFKMGDINARIIDTNLGYGKYDINLLMKREVDFLSGILVFNTDIYDESLIEQLIAHFKVILNIIVTEPNKNIENIDILSDDEKQKQLALWNSTNADYSKNKTIHELFEEQVERIPDKIAVVYRDRYITYKDLSRRSNQLAHYLQKKGVRADDLVAICFGRSLKMIISILGVLKSGGAYLPLGPDFPEERMKWILKDAGVSYFITADSYWNKVGVNIPHLIQYDLEYENISRQPKNTPINITSPNNLAYCIYTSGTTGNPKGVLLTHRNVVRLMRNDKIPFLFTADDVWTLFHSYYFDFSVWEIYGAVLYGGKLVIVGEGEMKDPNGFFDLLIKEQVTILNQTPSAFSNLLLGTQNRKKVDSSLRYIIFGGEELHPFKLKEWQMNYPEIKMINMYGITETTVHVTFKKLNKSDIEINVSNIGRPIPTTTCYIMDEKLQMIPVGVTGELCVGGAGVARGYLGNIQLTVEKFVINPYRPEELIYRSGDLVKYLPDGEIVYIGRIDNQVQLRGFRIELSEIESVMLRHPAVREAIITVREEKPGDKRLVAYITSSEFQKSDASEIRNYLKKKLPDYMVPSAYVFLDQFPLTSNGKIDRGKLPMPEGDSYARGVYEAPVGKVEEMLSKIWSEFLKVDQVGRNDNFFELGGHSLLAVHLIERLRHIGLHTDVQSLFTSPTLKDLAVLVGQADTLVAVPPNLIQLDSEKITPEMLTLITLDQEGIDRIIESIPRGASNIQDIYPLAPLQEGMLFHHLMGEERDVYVQSSIMAFNNRELLDKFLSSFQSVIERHDILRTAILWEDLPEPVQVVLRKAEMPVEEVTIDLSAGKAVDQMNERFVGGKFRIDIRNAPMIHAFIAKDDNDERWILALLFHHMIMDHTTLDILFQEIGAYMNGKEALLPEALPFRNYIVQARLGVSQEEHEAFFQKMLSDIEDPTAPYGLLDIRGDGTDIEEGWYDIDISLSRRIRDCARKMRVSAASIFHLAWAMVLGRLSNRDDVVFGTILFGRMQGGEGAERVMGMFINTLPVRIEVKNHGVEEAVKKTHHILTELFHHEHATLALAQRCSGVATPTPLFSSLFNYRYISMPGERGENKETGIRIKGIYVKERTNYPFGMSVNDLGGEYSLTAQVQSPINPNHICEYMNTVLEHLADALENAPHKSISSIDVLSEVELNRILYEWNDTEVEYPRDKCIHELFEEQVERTPDAIAIVYDEEEISYRELNRKSNHLARYLQSNGVKADIRVGICMNRSLEMIVSILGVLKSGGVYLPLDPDYPEDRLLFMISDSKASMILTEEKFADCFNKLTNEEHQETAPVMICLESEWENTNNERDENILANVTSQNSAYIIYTSGSTGKPKGVIGYHGGLCNLMKAQTSRFGVNAKSRILQFASISFDASISEIIMALCTGAVLNMAQKRSMLPGYDLEEMMDKLIITHITLPPSALTLMSPENVKSVRQMIIAGEACSSELAKQWYNKLRFINAYGPTETTVCATMGEYIDVQSKPFIGRPIDNAEVYILDPCNNPVPVGVSGELYIGGIGVSYGYLNRAELTAEKYIPSSFTNKSGSRLYKTGDLAKYIEDGNIDFIGRIDKQVKIRGYRIELGEIESCLRKIEGIDEAVVLAREDMPGEKRLVAYYTVLADSNEITIDDIRSRLSKHLPDYMVPSAYVVLDKIPLTPNGKIDREKLPTPWESRIGRSSEYVAPRTLTESILAKIWTDILGVDKVGIHDDFFEIGGDSILSARVVSRAKKVGLEMTIKHLFENPTIFELAASACETPPVQVVQGLVTGPAPLAPVQHEFFEIGIPEYYNLTTIPMMFEMPHDINTGSLHKAIDHLIYHHDVLRLRFVKNGSTWIQIFGGIEEYVIFTEVDLSDLLPEDQQKNLLMAINSLEEGLNVLDGPIIRSALFNLGSDKKRLLFLAIHHLAFDVTISHGILLEDLQTAYEQLEQGNEIQLLPKTTSFKQWSERLADYAQSDKACDELEYWLNATRKDISSLPTDYSLDNYLRGGLRDDVWITLSRKKTEALLYKANQTYNTNINDILITALVLTLSEWIGKRHLLFYLIGHGREDLFDDVDISRTVGYFASACPVLITLPDSSHPGELLKSVKEQLRDIPNNGIGYGILRYLHRDSEVIEGLKNLPQPEVVFNYKGQTNSNYQEASLLTPISFNTKINNKPRPYKLNRTTFAGDVINKKLYVQLFYNKGFYRKKTIEKLAEHYKANLESLIDHCLQPDI